jgi:hypothetical protein
MIGLFWVAFWALLSGLVVAAGWKAYARRRAVIGRSVPRLDDEAIRAILATGAVAAETDEPLDLSEIQDEEERFWAESWDEPEED